MIIVLFEVTLKKEMKQPYLNMAEMLQIELEKIKGFISLERFTCNKNENKMLSLQVWENEKSIIEWRENGQHKKSMPIGFQNIFEDYKINILKSIRTYGKYERAEAPINVNKLKS